jgi:predicted permease
MRRSIDALRARFALLIPKRAEARIEEELAFHIDMEAQRIARDHGVPIDEARRLARATFGGVTQHREELRAGRGVAWLGGLSLDFRLGLRMLARTPGLTAVSLLGLSVAVAVGAFAFAAVSTVTSDALPFADGDRIVAISNLDRRRSDDAAGTHLHDLDTWRRSLSTVENLGGYRTFPRNLIAADGRSASVRVAEMSAAGFALARIAPIRGRYFTAADESPAAPPVVVIGYDSWQTLFAGRDDIVGSHVRLGNDAATVIGVMPAGFAFPVNNQAWTPLRLNAADYEPGKAPAIRIFGRLAPGASYADARTQLTAIGQGLAREFPATYRDIQPQVMPYAHMGVLGSPSVAWLLRLGEIVVSLLLVVIGVNVAVLVYARTASRAGEMAVRTALGASRRRIVTQLFVEALVLSSMAATLGVVFAQAAFARVEAMIRQSADDAIPFWVGLHLTPGLVVYVAGLAVLAAVIIGVVPGLKATSEGVQANLKDLTGGSSMQLGRTWTALLIAQVAVSVAALPVALAGASTWTKLAIPERSPPAMESVLIATPLADLQLNRSRPTENPRIRYASQVEEIARRLETTYAGLDAMVMSSPPGAESYLDVVVEDAAAAERSTGGAVSLRVEPGFFADLDIRLLSGRAFTSGDYAPASRGVIVNRSFMRQYFAGKSPLGRRIHEEVAAKAQAGPTWEIVGVVDDFPALREPDALRPKIYLPLRAGEAFPLTIAVRARGTSLALAVDHIRQVGLSVDPTLRFRPIRPLDDMLLDEVRAERMGLFAFGMVALSVVLLSATGIYALMAFTVTRRRREIGIRTALGAQSSRVLAGILGRSMRHIGIGIAIGTIGAGSLVRVLGDSSPPSKTIFQLLGVAAMMVGVGLLATIGPARRALRVPPNETLRAE